MKWACWVMKVFHSLILLRASGIWQLCPIANVTKGTLGNVDWDRFCLLSDSIPPMGNFRYHEPCGKFSLEKTCTGNNNTPSSNISIFFFAFHYPCKENNLLTHYSGRNIQNYCKWSTRFGGLFRWIFGLVKLCT